MNLYQSLIRPLLFRFPPETAHEISLHLLGSFSHVPGLLPLLFGKPQLCPVEVCGIRFPNPVGLAAGMDKNSIALSAWQDLGFGFVEAGTITAHAQPGNPRPRMFRYPSKHALVNRMGFNNEGCDSVRNRLEKLFAAGGKPKIPLGLNLGKSKVTELDDAPSDYLRSFQALYEFGDYFVVNVSSPNTPGLRDLQAGDALRRILSALREWESPRSKPVFVKLAPDLEFENAREAIRLSVQSEASGFIATNTTLDHSALTKDEDQTGGLSGSPLKTRAQEFLRFVLSETDLPVIASGGVMRAEDAMQRKEAGAALVQLYTGFVYGGPALIHKTAAAWGTDQ